MAEYIKITTHEADIKKRLLFQFRRKNGTFTQLVSALGNRYQGIENVLNDIYLKRFIDNAEGVVLDWIAQETGIRNRPVNFTDEQFRILIKAHIAANTSQGIKSNLENILKILGSEKTNIKDIPYASASIQLKGNLLISLEDIKNILIKATAPISFEITKYTDTPFGFLEDPTSFGFDVGELGDSIHT